MNKQDFLLKTVMLFVGIAVIIGTWFSFSTIDQQTSKIDKLEEKVERQKDQISFLKNTNQEKTLEFQESENRRINESVNVFLQAVFNVQKDNFEERRSNAENILTQDMFEKIFPTDKQPEKLLYEYDFGDVRIYTRVDSKNASAYVIFDQTIENLVNNEKNEHRKTIELFLQKEGESWVVNKFQQINAEPL
jgi:hypothetical protein